jgi:Fe-S cluster assembly iron-binding protein IscA
MDIADDATKGDVTIEKNGLKVFLDGDANRLLSEATIDYADETGFVISGMQQTSSCC